jgi:hypothetical protein
MDTVEACIKIVEALREARHHASLESWQHQVDRGLADLLHNTDRLLDAVGQLGITMKDGLRVAFATDYISHLRGEVLNLQAILAPSSDRSALSMESRSRLSASVERICTLAYSADVYGSASVAPMLFAVSVVQSIMPITTLPESEVLYTTLQFRTLLMQPLLDPERPDSLVSAERRLLRELSSIADKLKRRLREVTLGSDPPQARFAVAALARALRAYAESVHTKESMTTVDRYEHYSTTLSGDVDHPETITASPIKAAPVEVGSILELIGTRVAMPRISESGKTANTKSSCEELRRELILEARQLARERKNLVHKSTQISALIGIARVI